MNNTVKTELKKYLLDCINDETLTNENKDEWHYYAFNQNYYIMYETGANYWLQKHKIGIFNAINIVKQYEEDNFGKFNSEISAEQIANMVAYIYGEEIIHSYDAETVEELESQIKNDLSTFDKRVQETDKDFVFFNVDNFGTITNYTFSNDYKRYENKYDKFLPVEKAKNIEINLLD